MNKYMPLNINIFNHIYPNAKSEIFFMTRSFLFHTRNNSFHDMVISLVQQRKILQHTLSLTSIPTNSETY